MNVSILPPILVNFHKHLIYVKYLQTYQLNLLKICCKLAVLGGMITMSQKFDALKQKIQNADKDQIKNIIQTIKQEKEQGNIDENEKQSLIDTAKKKVGDNFDFGKFGL